MHRIFLVPALVLATSCHVRPESLVPASASSHAPRRSDYLCGRAESFVVLGDEGSFVWPELLQELLDDHAEKPRFYRVLNGSVATQGIGPWLDPSTVRGGPLQALQDDYLALDARLRNGAPAPRTALCCVSLRGLGDPDGPVKTENDMVGAEMGADSLERLALELVRRGVERVVFATPIFAPEAGGGLGLERIAIARLLARGHAFVAAGPDLFTATHRYYPDAYERDGSRPNEFGLKLVAEEWYRWLAGPEAREPAVEALYARAFDVEALEASHERSRGLPRP